jgi:hypothetical protein
MIHIGPIGSQPPTRGNEALPWSFARSTDSALPPEQKQTATRQSPPSRDCPAGGFWREEAWPWVYRLYYIRHSPSPSTTIDDSRRSRRSQPKIRWNGQCEAAARLSAYTVRQSTLQRHAAYADNLYSRARMPAPHAPLSHSNAVRVLRPPRSSQVTIYL